MALAVVYSRVNVGIEAKLVEVEVHLTPGTVGFTMVGLAEAVVKEAKERVRSAIINSQFKFPVRKIVVNLAPADLPKEGGRYDLAIALGILAASKQINKAVLSDYEFGGELALTGELRGFNGALPMIVAAERAHRAVILPKENATESEGLLNARVYQADNLLSVCHHLQSDQPTLPVSSTQARFKAPAYPDLSDVSGQYQARRALEIAAAAGHSLLMIGSPGSGKTMLANRLPGLLPSMSANEAIEVAAVQSMCASASVESRHTFERPFRSPHHSASGAAIIGGGRQPKPGEVSLAHAGVLFLDELPEFNRACLEALREPLESGEVLVSRAAYTIKYPARFQLIAAMNPCPCGYWLLGGDRCNCSADRVAHYQRKISGPLLDRIDLQVQMQPIEVASIIRRQPVGAESSAVVRARVIKARALQIKRGNQLNSALNQKALNSVCLLDESDEVFLEKAIAHYKLSARSYHRTLKVARTIADLEGVNQLARAHLQEALSFRRVC